jgi:hypothetical protein
MGANLLNYLKGRGCLISFHRFWGDEECRTSEEIVNLILPIIAGFL